MATLAAGLILLIGMHLLPTVPAWRQSLVVRLGEWPYKGLFALVSLGGLLLIVLGMGSAPKVMVWQPPSWTRSFPQVLMLPALILLLAAYIPGNLKRLTPHPMLWGVVLWSVAHLAANGDLPGLLLFGSLGLYALYAIHSANRRGARPSMAPGPVLGDLVVVAGGIALYVAILLNHALLFGVPTSGWGQ